MGSNLPPGTTPGDIDRHFGGGHEHEFEEVRGSTDEPRTRNVVVSPDRELFEDGAFILIYQCRHAPVEGAWTDSVRDEMYTKHGPRCEAERQVVCDASRLEVHSHHSSEWYTIATSDSNVFHEAYANETAFSHGVPKDVGAYVADAICDRTADVARHDADGVNVDAGHHERVVTIDGTRFMVLPDRQIRITYDNVSERVRE